MKTILLLMIHVLLVKTRGGFQKKTIVAFTNSTLFILDFYSY